MLRADPAGSKIGDLQLGVLSLMGKHPGQDEIPFPAKTGRR
jgi:hypothetical protein